MMTDLLGAEWLKLRTTRLLAGMIPAAIGLSIAAIAGTVLSADSAGIDLETSIGIRRTLHVTGTGALLVLVVGIIITAGEYRTQTSTDTFLTTPRRERVLAAKLGVGASIGLGVGVITATMAAAVATLLYRTQDARLPLGSEDVWLTLAGTLAYTTLFAVLGIAIGSLIRNQVIAIAGSLVWFALVEQILINLATGIGKWLPGGAGQAIIRAPEDDLLSPAAGAAVLLGYAALIGLISLALEARRDA
jgi:ABC-2 type transport system permease protein